jgi:hypothetical protein
MKTKMHIVLAIGVLALLSCGKAKKKDFPHLSKLMPASQYFHIDPAHKSIIRSEKGSTYTIQPDSFVLPNDFVKTEKIEIHLIEATRSLEFAALPVSLEFSKEGRDTLFESAGMFFIDATYHGKAVPLAKGKKIKVKFRTDVSGDKFYVYHYDAAKGWQKHGHNHELREPVLLAQAMSPASGVSVQPRSDGQPGVEFVRGTRTPTAVFGGLKDTLITQTAGTEPLDSRVMTAEGVPSRPNKPTRRDKAVASLYRIYSIDKLNWWNFDYPKPSLTCLKGTITGSDAKFYSVTVFSKTAMGAYTLYLPKDFKISFYRNTIARVFVIDEQGNIAKTAYFETPDRKGHHKLPGSICEDVGPLVLKPLPAGMESDPDKLRNYLQKAGDGN